jgi:hypothetical protein
MSNYKVTTKGTIMSLGSSDSIDPRIFEIDVMGDEVNFVELCDEYFNVTVTADEATKILADMIVHINLKRSGEGENT